MYICRTNAKLNNMKIRETLTLCEKNQYCECLFCTEERRRLKRIPKISDELAEKYGIIADKMHKQLFTKLIEPSWAELKKLKL